MLNILGKERFNIAQDFLPYLSHYKCLGIINNYNQKDLKIINVKGHRF